MRKMIIGFTMATALLLASCGQADPPLTGASLSPSATPTAIATPTPTPAQPPTPTQMPTAEPSPVGTNVPAELIQNTQQRLAAHLGLSDSKLLTLRRAEAREWSDASLGCPAPDQLYPQVITPGFLLEFAYNNQTFEVHTGMQGQLMVLCDANQMPTELGNSDAPTEQAPVPSPSSANPAQPPVVELARQHLADKLKVNVESITVVEVKETEWSDSSLGCPQPDMNYLQVITPGYQVILEAQGQRYEYHTNESTQVVHCEPQGR